MATKNMPGQQQQQSNPVAPQKIGKKKKGMKFSKPSKAQVMASLKKTMGYKGC